jgi:type I restriction enzyme S subunit
MAMGPFGSRITRDNFVPAGVPVIRGCNLSSGRFVDDGFVFVSEEKADDLVASNARTWDLIFTHRGTIGQVGIIPADRRYDRYVVSQSQMKLSCDSSKVDPRFVFYFFRSGAGQHQLLMSASTTGVPALSRPLTSLKKIRIPLPPLRQQHVIADILWSLDDKIELNRRMNETLEAMARAIFKSWFIDFDPVRAKAEGRDPGLPKHIADLFPDSLEHSELGMIPSGWESQPIGNSVRCVGGATPSTKQSLYWNGGAISFVTPRDMSRMEAPVILDSERHITEAGANRISSGLLPAGTVLLSSRAPIGYLGITQVPVTINQGIIAMVCNGILPNYYVLYWSSANMEIIEASAGGTTFAEISKTSFRPIQALIPDRRVLGAFVDCVGPFHNRIVASLLETRVLAATRDALLPKLLSGEIRVEVTEKPAEDGL